MSVPIHKLDGSFLIFISHPFQWTYLVLVAKVRKLSSKSNIANLAVVAVVPVWGSIYKAHIEVIDEEGKTDLLVASQASANSTAFNRRRRSWHCLSITYLDWIFLRLLFYNSSLLHGLRTDCFFPVMISKSCPPTSTGTYPTCDGSPERLLVQRCCGCHYPWQLMTTNDNDNLDIYISSSTGRLCQL